MKKTLIRIILPAVLVTTSGFYSHVQAQGSTPPQPPGYHNNTNNNPPGGGAPLGDGLWLFMAGAVLYGKKKYLLQRKITNNQ